MSTAVAMLLASSVTVASANNNDTQNFKDIEKTDPFYKEIHKLSSKGIIKGYEDGTFRAQNQVTRAQAASLLANALQLDLTVVEKPKFKDVDPKSSHYRAIAKLTELGVFNNTEKFNPDKGLTRSQMTKILVESFKLQAETKKKFDDVTAEEAMHYIGTIGALNITTNEGKFNPSAQVTRGQLAAFLERTITFKRGDGDDDLWDDWDDWEELDDLYDDRDDDWDDQNDDDDDDWDDQNDDDDNDDWDDQDDDDDDDGWNDQDDD